MRTRARRDGVPSDPADGQRPDLALRRQRLALCARDRRRADGGCASRFRRVAANPAWTARHVLVGIARSAEQARGGGVDHVSPGSSARSPDPQRCSRGDLVRRPAWPAPPAGIRTSACLRARVRSRLQARVTMIALPALAMLAAGLALCAALGLMTWSVSDVLVNIGPAYLL